MEPGVAVIPGEEDLLACYLSSSVYESVGPKFPDVPAEANFLMREGEWKEIRGSKQYRSRKQANRVSYLWDELIEFQTSPILAGSSGFLGSSNLMDGLIASAQQEAILRKMAEEPRVIRRILGAAVDRARKVKKKGARFTSTIFGRRDSARAYVVMTLAKPPDMSYAAYREHRQHQLMIYCEGCKLKNQKLKEVLGIAMEPYSTKTISVDFLLMVVRDENLVTESAEIIQKLLKDQGMWQSDSMKWYATSINEFPDSPLLWRKIWNALFRRE